MQNLDRLACLTGSLAKYVNAEASNGSSTSVETRNIVRASGGY
jgi:hypothetical protein